jgi:hypothetical protein
MIRTDSVGLFPRSEQVVTSEAELATERSRRHILRVIAGVVVSPSLALLSSGCAVSDYRDAGLMIGSSVSRNIFVDANQFANKSVRVRLRNSSGDPGVDMSRMRTDVESSLRSAGYSITDKAGGIVLDANLYFLNTVATGRQRAANEVGALLGGVAGYEAAKGRGGLSPGSGLVIGAIAGATLQDVLRRHNDYDSYLAVCDVNIGVVRQQGTRRDSFVIGGNRFERERDEQDSTFDSFALRETVKVYVWAGDLRTRREGVMQAIQERLARVVANLM